MPLAFQRPRDSPLPIQSNYSKYLDAKLPSTQMIANYQIEKLLLVMVENQTLRKP